MQDRDGRKLPSRTLSLFFVCWKVHGFMTRTSSMRTLEIVSALQDLTHIQHVRKNVAHATGNSSLFMSSPCALRIPCYVHSLGMPWLSLSISNVMSISNIRIIGIPSNLWMIALGFCKIEFRLFLRKRNESQGDGPFSIPSCLDNLLSGSCMKSLK